METGLAGKVASKHSLPVWIAASATIAIAIAGDLHSARAAILWCMAIGLWAFYFWPDVAQKPSRSNPRPFSLAGLVIVLIAAAGTRLYRLVDLPLGPFVDEIFTLNSTLAQLEQPFDPFGHTLVLSQAWGKDHANLFLYLNLPVLKFFGVTYWSAKLLPVVPGVIACAIVFLIAGRVFNKPVAIATAVLFATAHWSIRLNRYGWDVSLMLMMFALAIWLLLVGMQSGRIFYSYCSGIAAGVSLYSYLGARIAVISLASFIALECAARRERAMYRQAAAFLVGLLIAAYPFFCYYLSAPAEFWARTSEVSVFNHEHPVRMVLNNIASHALMFHWRGGTFARDNYPGLPMMDPLSGLLLVSGLVILVRKADTFRRFMACTFVLNFLSGIFSASQEGAPYIYRTAAVIVPAFLATGAGLEWFAEKAGPRKLLILAAPIVVLNLYFYFSLERKNIAAMRVMAYESRLIGVDVARDNLPVWLVIPDVLTQTELHSKPAEEYANANPAVLLPAALWKLAIINFSGRYDIHQTLSENLAHPKDMYFVEPSVLTAGLPQGPAKIIFKSGNPELTRTADRLAGSVRPVPDILGEPLLTVAEFR
ncbi:MAG: hypothetical protein AUI91_07200 [Acidobacteria bacterium 13_1_40CM_3_56_11]|nr:MAG: hypothetical protein AUI91_07200 [Acidobacteria bacterium 13_1_40CM_3_56_11]